MNEGLGGWAGAAAAAVPILWADMGGERTPRHQQLSEPARWGAPGTAFGKGLAAAKKAAKVFNGGQEDGRQSAYISVGIAHRPPTS